MSCEQNKNQPVAHGESGWDGDKQKQPESSGDGDSVPGAATEEIGPRQASEDAAKRIPDKQIKQKRNDKSPEHTDIPQHFPKLKAFLRSLRFRHVLTHEHDSVDDSRNKKQSPE